MILADTSVWIDHLRLSNPVVRALLGTDQLVMHPFVIGELALGTLPRRIDLLGDLRDLQAAPVIDSEDVMTLIDRQRLIGLGLGWVDVSLLASVLTDRRLQLWTRDKRLFHAAQRLHVAFSPHH